MTGWPWYILSNEERIDSPALLVFPDRIAQNINEMIRIAGSPDRLIPHVKTHKMSAVVKMQLEAGIKQFKCATIAEAEMLAMARAKDILVAYQLNKQKLLRFIQLIKRYPESNFASLVDNVKSAGLIHSIFKENELIANIYMDIDNGMHRTGFPVGEGIGVFYEYLKKLQNVTVKGFHVYDGHICETDPKLRRAHCKAAMASVNKALKNISTSERRYMRIIAGGSPTFPIHALDPNVICSPGTTVLWDKGYRELLPDLSFLYAVVLFTNIISKPSERLITVDLGYKSVACENPVGARVFFLNLNDYQIMSQDEEHLVMKVNRSDWIKLEIGDALYGIPFHVCPTVALYEEVQVVQNGSITGQWKVEARNKKINI